MNNSKQIPFLTNGPSSTVNMCRSCPCCHCLYEIAIAVFSQHFLLEEATGFVCVYFVWVLFFLIFHMTLWVWRFSLLLKTHPLLCILQHFELVEVRMIYCVVLDQHPKKAVAEVSFIPCPVL